MSGFDILGLNNFISKFHPCPSLFCMEVEIKLTLWKTQETASQVFILINLWYIITHIIRSDWLTTNLRWTCIWAKLNPRRLFLWSNHQYTLFNFLKWVPRQSRDQISEDIRISWLFPFAALLSLISINCETFLKYTSILIFQESRSFKSQKRFTNICLILCGSSGFFKKWFRLLFINWISYLS